VRDDDLEESELEDWGDVFEYEYGLPGQGFDYSGVGFCDQSVDGRDRAHVCMVDAVRAIGWILDLTIFIPICPH
jgi:hypothetical protein